MNTVASIPGAGQALPTVAAPIAPEETAERRELIQAIQAVNAAELFGENSELTFVLDPRSHRPVVRVVDRQTRELLEQIPPEDVLRMARDLEGPGQLG